MRVLLVTFEYPPFAGGIATYAHTVAESLSALGCTVRVLAPGYPGSSVLDAGSAAETVRMRVGHGTLELVRFLPGTAYLAREVRSFRPDVVLLASDLAHGIGAGVCSAAGVPFVPVVHGSEVAKHFPPSTVKQRVQAVPLAFAYRRAPGVVCVSAYVKSLMTTAGFAAERLTVIHNGIGDHLVEADRDEARIAALRARHGVGEGPVLLTFARLTPRKGQDAVIRALPSLLVRHPTLCYVVAGTGDDAPRLRAEAASLGVEHAVRFIGRVDEEDKIPLLDLCDVYVLPSREEAKRVEGLGIALLEAAARARPLVAGRHGGVPEIVRDGESGFLVDPLDAAQLAERLGRLLEDRALGSAMGAAGRETVRRGFLARGMAQSYLALFRELAG